MSNNLTSLSTINQILLTFIFCNCAVKSAVANDETLWNLSFDEIKNSEVLNKIPCDLKEATSVISRDSTLEDFTNYYLSKKNNFRNTTISSALACISTAIASGAIIYLIYTQADKQVKIKLNDRIRYSNNELGKQVSALRRKVRIISQIRDLEDYIFTHSSTDVAKKIPEYTQEALQEYHTWQSIRSDIIDLRNTDRGRALGLVPGLAYSLRADEVSKFFHSSLSDKIRNDIRELAAKHPGLIDDLSLLDNPMATYHDLGNLLKSTDSTVLNNLNRSISSGLKNLRKKSFKEYINLLHSHVPEKYRDYEQVFHIERISSEDIEYFKKMDNDTREELLQANRREITQQADELERLYKPYFKVRGANSRTLFNKAIPVSVLTFLLSAIAPQDVTISNLAETSTRVCKELFQFKD